MIAFRTNNPDTVEIIATTREMEPKKAKKFERFLHTWYAPFKIKGEWFLLTPHAQDELETKIDSTGGP